MKRRSVFALLTLVAAGLGFASGEAEAKRNGGSGQGGGAAQGGYVVEFRSRPTDIFGHAYVVVGRQTRGGGIAATRKAGFMPDPAVSEVKALGRVKGLVTFTEDDRRIAPDEKFRVRVSKATYDRVVAKIDGNKRRQPSFGLFEQNCNTFAATVARSAGLKTPSSEMLLPRDYVRTLRAVNTRTARAE